MNYKEYGKRLRIERQNRNLSQEDLSRLTGLSVISIGKIENGGKSRGSSRRKIEEILKGIPKSRFLRDDSDFKNGNDDDACGDDNDSLENDDGLVEEKENLNLKTIETCS